MIFRETEAGRQDPDRRRRIVFVVVWAVVLVGVLIAFRAILVPFVLAALLAYVLSPVVHRLMRLRIAGRAPDRWMVVLALYLVMLTTLTASVVATAPIIAEEVRDFVRDEVPQLRQDVEARWLPKVRALNQRFLSPGPTAVVPPPPPEAVEATREQSVLINRREDGSYRVVLPAEGIVVERDGRDRFRLVPARVRARHDGDTAALVERLRAIGAGHADDIFRVGRGILVSLIGGIFGFFITLMLSAYILVTEDRILAFVRSLVRPQSRLAFDELLFRIDRGLSGVVRGQLLICAVNGVLSAVGFAIAHLKYWPVLALLAAVFSLVPIFGAILSSIPAVAIGLTQGVGTGLFVLLWILGIHQLEANLLNPKIMGDAAKIHPVLVVFALLAGEHFFGILGALLAVPVMSVAQSVFLHWRKYSLSYGDPSVARDSIVPPAISPIEPRSPGGG